jgi:hypothetical protein
MYKKNLILCFSSLRPSQYNEQILDDREKNYKLSLEWLLKSLPKNWDIIYNDNTLNDLSELKNEELKSLLSNKEIIRLFLHKTNEGSINKGAGEHDMCRKSFLEVDPEDYNWITYFTSRHIIPNSWYFDKLDTDWKNYECIMSNPEFYYLSNYSQVKSSDGLYNDMLFSMKSGVFKKFIDHIDVQLLKDNHKNSENHLFEFIRDGNFKNLEIESLGILRNDHQSYGWHLV